MMLHIPKVLAPEQVVECRRLLDAAEWIDGKATVGEQGAMVKRNRQLPELSPLSKQLGEMILSAVARHPLFFSAALPLKSVPPLFNRYEGGEAYGNHIDGAVRAVPGSSHFIRTDLSSTLFLSDPAEYDGGELVMDTAGVPAAWRGNAGDVIVYPANTLHRVTEVTRGTRDVAISWIQSMVREGPRRRILYDLKTALEAFDALPAPPVEAEAIRRSYLNLVRMWA